MNNQTVVQALHYLIYKAGDGVMTKLYLLKTIYLADRYHLRQYGRTITNAKYVAMRLGPVPSEVKDTIEASIKGKSDVRKLFVAERKGNHETFKSVCTPCRDDLSDTEIEALDAALDKFREIGKGGIVTYTHNFPEWKNRKADLSDHCRFVPMDIEDFFLPADPQVEYCPADPELVKMNLDFYRGED